MAESQLIDTDTDNRYVRRDERGRSVESHDAGRSLSADRRQTAKPAKGPGRQGRPQETRRRAALEADQCPSQSTS